MFSSVVFLLFVEILQFVSLGPYANLSELTLYFNFDNVIQLMVIFLAAACLVTQHEEIQVKWCSAFGIVFAYLGKYKMEYIHHLLLFHNTFDLIHIYVPFSYLQFSNACIVEFVFLLGRCPSLPWIRAGQNSIMFYNITRRLLKILFNLFVLVVGFAFGFFILQKDTPHDHFENPIKSIVKVNSV